MVTTKDRMEFRQCRGQKVDVWLGTSPAHTLAPSHINHAILGPGNVVSDTETLKSAKYAQLPTSMLSVPIAIEISVLLATKWQYSCRN